MSAGAHGAQKILTLNYPQDKSVREYGLMGISINLPWESVERLTISVNGKQRTSKVPASDTECFSVPVEPGVNKIEINAYKDERVSESLTFDVFRRSDLVGEYRNIPADYKRDFFHRDKMDLCTKCHELKPGADDAKPINPATFSKNTGNAVSSTSTCYSCHKSIMNYPYVHGPASVWSCLSCHETGSSPMYTVKKPDTEICYSCHIEQKSEWVSKKYTHGPVTIGKCTICHSPHASENAFILYKSTWDLCINCHAEKANGVHVIGDAMFRKGHPTHERPDPVQIGRELTCASCHNPHASNYPHLWAFEADSLYDFCQKCHNKK